MMKREEVERIIAENKKKDAVVQELVDTVTKNNLERVKSIFEANSSIIKNVIVEVNSADSRSLLRYVVDNKMAKYLIEQGVSLTAAIKNAIPDLKAIKSICETNKSIVKRELQKDVSILESVELNKNNIDDIINYLAE